MTDFDRNIYLQDIPLETAVTQLHETLHRAGRDAPLPGEALPLPLALGRVTAEPVWARLSSPHYHAAAMDGFAVRAAETIGATETRPLTLTLDAQAVPVNTGEPLPSGTDAVIMIEHVQQPTPQSILIRAAVPPWQHVRFVGEDMVATELVLPVNHLLRPVDLGAAAAAGYDQILVRRQPQVIIIPTGDELVAAGTTPQAGQIIEFNSLVLAAQVAEAGGQAAVTDSVPDDQAALRAGLATALQQQPDLVLVLAGSSAGSKDFTAAVIADLGELLVHGIAVRPGHPVVIGSIEGIPVIGVPGYPVSAALTGQLLIQPLVARWLGQQAPLAQQPRVRATMTRKHTSPTGDDDYTRVAVAQVGERLLATPLQRGAGVLSALVRADGLAHIPRFSEGVSAGQEIEVILYRSLESIRQTVLAIGSHDPLLDLLGQFLATQYPGSRLTSANVGSLGGLLALRRGEAHLAGSHLLDAETGEYNVGSIQRYLADIPLQLVTFAHREQGLIVPQGNPQGIRALDDLVRVQFVNRQRGSGTRLLLDYQLAQAGITPESVSGYGRELFTHLAVAAAVASGSAECGMGVRRAAVAMGLDFVPVGWERYDFVVPTAQQNHDGVRRLLALLQDGFFREALAAQPGYDTRETGQVQYTQ